MALVKYLPIFLTVLVLPGSAAGQQKFEATLHSRRHAIARGQVKEFQAAMEALALEAEKNQRWAEASEAFHQASAAAQQAGDLQKAIAHSTKAIELGEKAKNPYLQANPTLILANAYRRLRQVEKQRDWLSEGLEVSKQMETGTHKEVLQMRLSGALGRSFLKQGHPEKAIEHISYSVQRTAALVSYYKKNRRYLRNAEETIRNTEGNLTKALSTLGNAYLRVGKNEDAVKAFERGLTIVKTSKLDSVVESNLVHGLGTAYLAQKDYTRAMEHFTAALQLAEYRKQTNSIKNASRSIGDILLQTKRETEAIPYFKKAINAIESTRSLLESEEFRTSFFENKGQTYGGIILAYLGAKNVEEAFNYSERARSRAFLDILGSKVQLVGQGALAEEERTLQAKISELRAKLVDQQGDDEEEDDSRQGQVSQELEAAQKAYINFLAKVRKENKEQASLMNVEPLTLKQIQDLLDPGVTVLEYFVPRGRAMLWVVEKDQVNFVRLSLNRNELISKVTALRDSINQADDGDKLKQASEQLYRVLIEPALPYIRGKELLIIPHDVLHYLPFQALLSPQGKYLIQDYPIHYLSSASLMQFTKEKKRATRDKALVMGNPSLGDPAYNLRFAEREAKEVAQLYPQSVVFLRDQATKPTAISSSPNYEMLHFAVHAEFNEQEPLDSALLLAGDGKDDGRLKVGEIFSLNLKSDLVVLSACETGLGKISSGDEIIGLTRAFIYAGTPSVVTTLWKVNDRASYELMRDFYSNLKTTKKSEALRQAQLKTMQEFSHPFFWAAYGLTGEP